MLVRTNALGQPKKKKFVKYFRMESNVIATPALAAGMAVVYVPTGAEFVTLMMGGFFGLLGNFIFNYSNEDLQDEITTLGVLACVPVVGALVPKNRRLSSDSEFTFVKAEIPPERKSLRNFIDTNEEIEKSWDKLFQQETRTDVYSYIARNFFTDFLGVGSHAYQVGKIMRSFGKWGTPITPCRTEQMVCRKNISLAQAKGEYVPIHWELIAYPRYTVFGQYQD